MEAVCSVLRELSSTEQRVVGIDLVGGPATLLEAIVLDHGERVRYIPATALNKVRGAYRGGEQKSDPRDAFVIADQLRLRWRSLQEVRFREEKIAELCACWSPIVGIWCRIRAGASRA